MHRLALLVAVLLTVTCSGLAGTATAQTRGAYQAPVPGAVLRGFVAPPHPYGAGHRGVDLVARAGDPVRAAAAGEVVFAGTVGRDRWVTVRHADGVLTSYGALQDLRVRAGRSIAGGQVIGTAAGAHGEDVLRPDPGLHWSARRDGAYLDPLTLLDAPLPRPTLVGAGGWEGTHPVVEPYEPYPGGSRFAILATPSPVADRPGYAVPPNHHHLLQVPGYGTTGPWPVLDAGYLGYGDDDHSTFSYRGCDATPDGCEPRPYGGHDTDLAIDDAAVLLEEQLRARQRAQPHRPVDLLGHSMGGDVIDRFLVTRYDPDDPGLPPIGVVGTIATPHGGSGTASIARALGQDPIVGRLVELGRLGLEGLGYEPAGRVSLGSRPVARYGAPVWGARPERDPQRLAELGIEVLQIAGSRDGVVGRTDAAAGGNAYVLPGGHGTVLESEAVHEAWYRNARGQPLVPVGPRVGWGADAISDGARTFATVLDANPLFSAGRALRAAEVPGLLWEAGKWLVGGVGADDEQPPEPAVAPAAPRAPADAWS